MTKKEEEEAERIVIILWLCSEEKLFEILNWWFLLLLRTWFSFFYSVFAQVYHDKAKLKKRRRLLSKFHLLFKTLPFRENNLTKRGCVGLMGPEYFRGLRNFCFKFQRQAQLDIFYEDWNNIKSAPGACTVSFRECRSIVCFSIADLSSFQVSKFSKVT